MWHCDSYTAFGSLFSYKTDISPTHLQWPAGRCRGLSVTTFCLVLVTDYQLHLTVYHRQPSFSSCRCSCLEQSAWTRELCTLRGCLPVPLKAHFFLHLFIWLLVCAVPMHSVAFGMINVHVSYFLTYYDSPLSHFQVSQVSEHCNLFVC